ncbi:MAG: GGDEF domain-containing protein, partial [Myxococcales bacterium]
LEHTSRTDPLTSLANRRAMRELLAAEVSRARRHGSPLVVVSLDLDHFKAINDTYGHDAGDAVLVQVAAVMERNLRREDSCGRWGGEEFLMVLPECGLEASTNVAEKLRGRIEQATVILGGRTLRVTASIGVATFSVDDSVEDLLRRADDAMYAAKRGGRNRVVRR